MLSHRARQSGEFQFDNPPRRPGEMGESKEERTSRTEESLTTPKLISQPFTVHEQFSAHHSELSTEKNYGHFVAITGVNCKLRIPRLMSLTERKLWPKVPPHTADRDE